MKKILFLLTLIYSITSYSVEKTLLCRGIKHTGGSIAREASLTNQEQINFNFTFDATKQRLTLENTFFCDNKQPQIKTGDFSENEISHNTTTSESASVKCINRLLLNRNSGELKWLQIIGDSNAPALIYEGKFQCELAKQKF